MQQRSFGLVMNPSWGYLVTPWIIYGSRFPRRIVLFISFYSFVGFKVPDNVAASGQGEVQLEVLSRLCDCFGFCLILLKAGDDFWLLDYSSSFWHECVWFLLPLSQQPRGWVSNASRFHPTYLLCYEVSTHLLTVWINFEVGVPFQNSVKWRHELNFFHKTCASFPPQEMMQQIWVQLFHFCYLLPLPHLRV